MPSFTPSAISDQAERRIIFVLGMHRSGTSALTRLLNICGGGLPSDLTSPAPDNPDGFFEPKSIVTVHKALLRDIGSNWDDSSPIDENYFLSPAATAWRAQVAEALESCWQDQRSLIIKDPRICRLLPLWQALAAEQGLALTYVMPVRNPLEVAASLARRNSFALGRSLLLWLRYTLDAERLTRGKDRYFIEYATLLNEGPAAIKKLALRIGLRSALPEPELDAAINSFLKPDRRHHTASVEELYDNPQVPQWVSHTYRWVLAAIDGAPNPTELDRIAVLVAESELLYRPTITDAVQRAEKLSGELQVIRERRWRLPQWILFWRSALAQNSTR